MAKRILLLGWDAADWKVINKLVDEGKMPNLEGLIGKGVMGNLATLYPDISPMLWTSIATGKRPFNHGILGFTEPNPQGGGIRPITNLSRSTKAIWNILGQLGKKNIVISWWPSHPAEPINGVMVSNRYQEAEAPRDKPWPMKPGTVHPPDLVRELKELRTHPQDLDPRLIRLFVPRLDEIDQEQDRRIEGMAGTIADTITVKDAALHLMERHGWDLCAVYFDGIDHFCHGFMDYYPPKVSWVDDDDFKKYNQVVESGYRLHDRHLGEFLAKVDEETVVMIVSDHGFHSDHLRPAFIPDEPAGPTIQHRHIGMFVVSGPGIKEDEIIYGAGLLDITPTILTLLGLPVGEDMDGKPLINIFNNVPRIQSIASWDEKPGDDGRHPPDMQLDVTDAQEAINQLVALGYIEEPDEDEEKAVAASVRELNYNLARSYMDAYRHTEAIVYLEDLTREWPDEYRFSIVLAQCYETVGQIEKARPVIETLLERRRENVKEAKSKLKELREKYKGIPRKDLTRPQRRELRETRAKAEHQPYLLEYLMGSLLFAEGDEIGALNYLEKLANSELPQPGIYIRLGEVYLKMKFWEDAAQCFEQALALDPESVPALNGLAQSMLPRRMNKKAAETAMAAIALIYHNPRAHYLLGVALHRIGRLPYAVEALQTAVSQNPNFPEAFRRLARIHENRLQDGEKAREYQVKAEEAERRIQDIKEGRVKKTEWIDLKAEAAATSDLSLQSIREIEAGKAPENLDNTLVVVSGLPRTGTSMMMQMLRGGGLPLLTDRVRAADEDNPKGYYEYEPVLKLKSDNTWVREARGKAVKIVAQLLPHLPFRNGLDYRVIFMERPLKEVLASQKRMLARQNRRGAELSDDKLMNTFNQQVSQIKRLLSTYRVPTIFVTYRECVETPLEASIRINRFLGRAISELKAAAEVNPDLYRQRIGT